MKQKAINQGNPKNQWTDVMELSEKWWNAKIDATLLLWDKFVEENIKSDDYKYLLSLKPMLLDKIGPDYKEMFDSLEVRRDRMIDEMGIDKYLAQRKYEIYPNAFELGDWLPIMIKEPERWRGYWEGYQNRVIFDKLKEDSLKIYEEKYLKD